MKANVNPWWKPFAIPAKKLCANEVARPVLLEVLDWERSGAHRPIGYYTSTVGALTGAIFDCFSTVFRLIWVAF